MRQGIYMGAPPEGKEWTIEDIWNLKPGELPPWNPEGIRLDPADFATRAEFDAAVNQMVDDSGYRALYDEWKRGRPGTVKRFYTEKGEREKRMRNLLLIGAGVLAAVFAFGG